MIEALHLMTSTILAVNKSCFTLTLSLDKIFAWPSRHITEFKSSVLSVSTPAARKTSRLQRGCLKAMLVGGAFPSSSVHKFYDRYIPELHHPGDGMQNIPQKIQISPQFST